MTKLHTTLLSTTYLVAVTFIGTTLIANAQARLELSGVTDVTYDINVRASNDCDDTDGRCEPGAREDISVVKELDKATPATAPDTNVCDGVTCPDGSCAATATECTVANVAPDYRDADSDGYGDATARPIREGGQTVDAGTVPEQTRVPTDTDGDGMPDVRDLDSNGDGIGDETERAQTHNSSRSNRTEGVALDSDFNDPDDDGDSLPTNVARGSADKASPLLFDTLRNRPESEGDEVDTDSDMPQARPFIKFDDIKGEVQEDTETGERRLSRVAVVARDLRNWTAEDRTAFTRLRDEIESNTPEAASLRVTEQLLADDRIEAIEATETDATVEYRATMRVLGFIPLERTVTARAQANGTVEIDYPWYRFLSTTPDNERINSLLLTTLDILVLVPGRAG